MSENHHFIRHFLATLAYRFQRAVRNAPSDFGDFEIGSGVRAPIEIVRHMTRVLSYAKSRLDNSELGNAKAETWDHEIRRFHQTLEQLDTLIENQSDQTISDIMLLLQGPFSDVMTHIGQLAMLRRLAGSPVMGESFMQAKIKAGQLGIDQPRPVKPFKT